MRKLMKWVIPTATVALLLLIPVVALAQFGNFEVNNVPMARETDISAIIVTVIQWIMGIVGLICIVMIIYGGVTYATAAGNEDRIEMGRRILLWAIVGLVIAIIAFTLARTVVCLFVPQAPMCA